MNKYIVKIKSPAVAETLRAIFEKVGNPQTLHNIVIVKTARLQSDIEAIPGVISVELDDRATLEYVNQTQTEGWGLPWVSNTGGDSYVNELSGEGVDIYILDTGIRTTHEDFTGRIRTLYTFDGKDYDPNDAMSPEHGTNVAGCAAGTRFGTAKLASVVNCRSSFYNTDILKALDVILKDHLDKPADIPSVLNFSGSTISSAIGSAFSALAHYGIVVVAAAGNYNEPEPRYPAASWYVVGVGALNQWDQPASFTNSGVTVYAPGQNITTAGIASDTASNMTSGTSFSSPYYAGLLACQLEGSDKFNSGILVDRFTFDSAFKVCDRDRIPPFENKYGPPVTVTTRNQGRNYYMAPSRLFSDEQIRDFCIAYQDRPQTIADEARNKNLDLARLAQATGFTEADINGYFQHHGVSPWWFVSGLPT